MGLTYHFRLTAPATATAAALADFLCELESEAKVMGFDPTIVVNAPFETNEQRAFSRRLTIGLTVTDPRLKRSRLTEKEGIWAHDTVSGSCCVAPAHGVVLVVTDERKRECVLGFFRYPAFIRDADGCEIMPTPNEGAWVFSEFIKTADPRYRKLVKRFAEAGFLAFEQDDYGISAQAAGET